MAVSVIQRITINSFGDLNKRSKMTIRYFIKTNPWAVLYKKGSAVFICHGLKFRRRKLM